MNDNVASVVQAVSSEDGLEHADVAIRVEVGGDGELGDEGIRLSVCFPRISLFTFIKRVRSQVLLVGRLSLCHVCRVVSALVAVMCTRLLSDVT